MNIYDALLSGFFPSPFQIQFSNLAQENPKSVLPNIFWRKEMKELMDGYVGVKFRAIQLSSDMPLVIKAIFPLFKQSAQLLKEYGMTPKNGGNISLKRVDGMVITSSGSNLGSLEEDEIVHVRKCSIEDRIVEYDGLNVPSSETFMHYLIYQLRSNIGAIVHAHDPATSRFATASVKETAKEEPYGTLDLAKIACDTFSKNEDVIILKNHGYVAVGQNLEEATNLIVSTHLKIVQENDISTLAGLRDHP